MVKKKIKHAYEVNESYPPMKKNIHNDQSSLRPMWRSSSLSWACARIVKNSKLKCARLYLNGNVFFPSIDWFTISYMISKHHVPAKKKEMIVGCGTSQSNLTAGFNSAIYPSIWIVCVCMLEYASLFYWWKCFLVVVHMRRKTSTNMIRYGSGSKMVSLLFMSSYTFIFWCRILYNLQISNYDNDFTW